MKYKIIEDGYIVGIGENIGGEEITEEEYEEIMNVINNKQRQEGKGYKLKEDLTWEEYDLPVIETPEGYGPSPFDVIEEEGE